MFVARRSHHNPIFTPYINHYWEAFATLNMSVVKVGRAYYGVYRAISAVDSLRSPKQMSTIGIAKSKDGLNFDDRKPFITPEAEWEKYGCEDPRITYFEGKYYTFYTAISENPLKPEGIRVAVAVSKNLKKVDERHLVTPFNAKAMTLFPERVNGKVTVVFSAHTDSPPSSMCIVQADSVEELWSPEFWEKLQVNMKDSVIDPRRIASDHVEVGATPIKTKQGWLFIYSHIKNYFQADGQEIKNGKNERVFTVEAVLLDLKDPRKIIGRTRSPILAPKEAYELVGFVPNVVFPTGTRLEKDKLTIYYGAVDTTVCMVHVSLSDLVSSMHPDSSDLFHFQRFSGNPIITPKAENTWESKATFNPAAIVLKGKTHLLYRAFSEDNTSAIGYAKLEKGTNVLERLPQPVYVPREEFETKKIKDANSGCEDPRLTKIGKNIYICYTAFDGIGPPRVAISSITEKNFLNKKWEWGKPFLITPEGLDDKDTCIFPKKFRDGYLIVHRVGSEICADYVKSLDFEIEKVKKCIHIIGPRNNMWDNEKVGITAPPIKTKHGWLLLYHGVSKENFTYRVGALLLDLKDPAIVLARSTDPIFEPVEEYEKVGVVPNVVFPCGMTVEGSNLYIYYGGADKVIGVAHMKLEIILKALVHGMRKPK